MDNILRSKKYHTIHVSDVNLHFFETIEVYWMTLQAIIIGDWDWDSKQNAYLNGIKLYSHNYLLGQRVHELRPIEYNKYIYFNKKEWEILKDSPKWFKNIIVRLRNNNFELKENYIFFDSDFKLDINNPILDEEITKEQQQILFTNVREAINNSKAKQDLQEEIYPLERLPF